MKIDIGDEVRLNLDAPWMKVQRINDNDTVNCVWSQNGKFLERDFNIKLLEKKKSFKIGKITYPGMP